MQTVSRSVLGKRLIVGVPVLAAALVSIFSGHSWATWLTFTAYAWTALVQALSVRFRPGLSKRRHLGLIWLCAFWAGPTVWIWAAIEILSSSPLVASIAAPVLGVLACARWQWASRNDRTRLAIAKARSAASVDEIDA